MSHGTFQMSHNDPDILMKNRPAALRSLNYITITYVNQYFFDDYKLTQLNFRTSKSL